MPHTRRRDLLKAAASAALLAATPEALISQAPEAPVGSPPAFGTAPAAGPTVTPDDFAHAEKLVQITLTPAGRAEAAANWQVSMAPLLERRTGPRTLALPPAIVPYTIVDHTRAVGPLPTPHTFTPSTDAPPLPHDDASIAYSPVYHLAAWIRTRQLTSERLTTIYLDRLRRFNPTLNCVITLTPDHALAQARRADQEIAAGHYRGPLQGIPWGAKDLLDTAGIPTTWGAEPFRNRIPTTDATVTQRLDDAGAVLVAKLSLGALALNDVWFGGETHNPWLLAEGSSGSSAGPGAATAAALVAFAIGSETGGSIVSPSMRCGVTGLRPTFGRVPRSGAMTLCWSLDKLGPMARSVEDTVLILNAISGPEAPGNPAGVDPSCVPSAPLVTLASGVALTEAKAGAERLQETCSSPTTNPSTPASEKSSVISTGAKAGVPGERSLLAGVERSGETCVPTSAPAAPITALKLGYFPRWMNQPPATDVDRHALEVARSLGMSLIPLDLPDWPYSSLELILFAESAAAFEDLTLAHREGELKMQTPDAWPNTFRQSRFLSAVDFVQADRLRRRGALMMAQLFRGEPLTGLPATPANAALTLLQNPTAPGTNNVTPTEANHPPNCVISTEAKRSGETCGSPATALTGDPAKAPDLLLVPSLRDEMLTLTNFTGHPSLTLRAGFITVSEPRSDWAPDPAHPTPHLPHPARVPHGITLIGRLFDEATLATVGAAFEAAFNVATERPPNF